MDGIGGKVLGASDNITYFFDNIRLVSTPWLILDVLLVSILFYWAYLFLHETKAMRILYGLFFLVALMMIGRLLDLSLLNWILKYLMAMLVVAIPIVFQPELRNALEKLGRTKFLSEHVLSKSSNGDLIDKITGATTYLSKQKIGALLVLQRQTGLREYVENGTQLEAGVSTDLLLSIFYPKSPLHDGAVIVAGDRILSARSVLPVSDISISSEMGTRHRAGIGITENSDAVAIIVSEETGSVSIAVNGKIERRISEERLKNKLQSLLSNKAQA